MKKLSYFLLLPLILVACKNTEAESATETESVCENCELFIGDFLYLDDAAILKGKDFIYGVALDGQAEALAKKVEPIKKESYDMVEVTVKGVLSKKPEDQEGWDEILSIKEILTIADEVSEADILIQQ